MCHSWNFAACTGFMAVCPVSDLLANNFYLNYDLIIVYKRANSASM